MKARLSDRRINVQQGIECFELFKPTSIFVSLATLALR